MLHSAITKSTTTLLKKIQHNPPPRDVAFSYYQKYNNITKKNITKDVAFGYYQKYNNITKKIKNITKDVAFGYYQKYNNITKKYNITKRCCIRLLPKVQQH